MHHSHKFSDNLKKCIPNKSLNSNTVLQKYLQLEFPDFIS